MAIPGHQPTDTTRKQVEALTAYGIGEADIAEVLAVELKVLRKHYRPELENGRARANLRVAESLYRTAIKGGREGTSAAIFWLKTRAGWSEFNAPRFRPPGKKEHEMREAFDAARGTDWEGLI
jgi:hypothetical protein